MRCCLPPKYIHQDRLSGFNIIIYERAIVQSESNPRQPQRREQHMRRHHRRRKTVIPACIYYSNPTYTQRAITTPILAAYLTVI